MCHAGIEEYVFPIYNSKIFGFVSVSGYAVNKTTAAKRISALSKEFMLNQNELLRVYESLNHQKPDIDKLSVIINPLVQMLILLNMLQPPVNAFDGGDNRIYNKALRFIERNYMEKITINNIAEYCSCSVSSISHIFPRKCGQTVKQYINSLRISQAKHLLSSSMLAIKTISALCGFEEPDYFSTVFKNYTGISPSGYRKTR